MATLQRTIPAFWAPLRDVLVVVLVMVCVKQAILPLSQLYAGPVSTLAAMVVATVLLRRARQRWADLGFRWPHSWRTIAWQTVVTLAVVLLSTGVADTIADRYFVDLESGGRFSHVEGNLAAYLGMLLLVWTHGSFFEELLYRAFMLSKLSEAFGGGRRADIAALVLSSVFFGYRHTYYQGTHGGLVTGAAGLAFGFMYLWFGRRNLLPLILAHGSLNTLAQTIRFLGITDDD